MAEAAPTNSVWTAMSYTPPRGRCNHKSSLMSPACACLRFMLHPVKAATSFDCDGCNHHASFHSLENAAEDAILEKWRMTTAASAASATISPQPRAAVRAIEAPPPQRRKTTRARQTTTAINAVNEATSEAGPSTKKRKTNPSLATDSNEGHGTSNWTVSNAWFIDDHDD